MVEDAIEVYGRIDVLVDNAAISNRPLGSERRRLDSMLAVNVKGCVLCVAGGGPAYAAGRLCN